VIKAFFVHGFNVKDNGASTIGKMLPFFANANISTQMITYGHFNLFEPRWENKAVAQRLKDSIQEARDEGYKIIVIAHSNGCDITQRAAEQGAVIDKAVLISAAIDNNIEFAPSIKSVDVWHSRKDWVLFLAKFMPFNRWGEMGRTGATRYDKRVKNFDRSQNYDAPSSWHSDLFASPLIEYFGPIILTESLLRLG